MIVPDPEDWLTIDEAAARAGVSRATLYRWLEDGRSTKYQPRGRQPPPLVDRNGLDNTPRKEAERPASQDRQRAPAVAHERRLGTEHASASPSAIPGGNAQDARQLRDLDDLHQAADLV